MDGTIDIGGRKVPVWVIAAGVIGAVGLFFLVRLTGGAGGKSDANPAAGGDLAIADLADQFQKALNDQNAALLSSNSQIQQQIDALTAANAKTNADFAAALAKAIADFSKLLGGGNPTPGGGTGGTGGGSGNPPGPGQATWSTFSDFYNTWSSLGVNNGASIYFTPYPGIQIYDTSRRGGQDRYFLIHTTDRSDYMHNTNFGGAIELSKDEFTQTSQQNPSGHGYIAQLSQSAINRIPTGWLS